jgi:HD-like signal output (HDOD) protein
MTPATENVDLTPVSSVSVEEQQTPAVQPETPVIDSLAAAIDQAERTEEIAKQNPASPARAFLDHTGLIQKLAPIRELNQQMRLEHPQMDNLYRVVEESPELLKRFLKFANSSWFNSRIQVDSPLMAFTRFGTAGFYRLMLTTFVQESIGELSTKFRIWPHLEWSARAGEMVAQQLSSKYVDKTFAAALLHDAVVAPMERELQDYLYFLECALNVDPVVTGLEHSCHEFNHAEAAAELARALEFDEPIIDAIAGHHNESMSAVPAGDSRVVLGLLLTTKRVLSIAHGQRKNAFDSATEKALLREIAAALNVSSGRVVNTITDVVDLLHLPAM